MGIGCCEGAKCARLVWLLNAFRLRYILGVNNGHWRRTNSPGYARDGKGGKRRDYAYLACEIAAKCRDAEHRVTLPSICFNSVGSIRREFIKGFCRPRRAKCPLTTPSASGRRTL